MKTSRKMTFCRYDYATFFSFFCYAAGSVVFPVALLALSRDLGFSLEKGGMTAGGALQLGRTFAIVASMLLCGFAAGRWGKRHTFGWSVLLMGIGFILAAFSMTYAVLFISLIIAGLGEGVVEGLATPFVQDLHDDEPGRYINFSHSFWSVGVLTTVLIVGALLSFGVHWRILVGSVATVTLIPVLLLLLPESKQKAYPEKMEKQKVKEIFSHACEIMRVPRFWLFFAAMFVAGGGEFCLTFWCASYIQINFDSSAWTAGIGTACFAGGMVLGRTGWGYIIKQRHLMKLIVFSAIGGTIVTLFLPNLNNIWLFFIMLFFSGVATAPFWPSIQSYCTDCMPEQETTMLFILLSCAGVPGCGFFTWLMGFWANRPSGFSQSFYLVPICYIVLLGLICFDWLFFIRAAKRHS